MNLSRPTFAPHALMLLASVLLSPGAAQALTPAEIANLEGADREKILMDGARKEGGMLWYTTLQVDEASRPLTEAFIKKYPFIKAELYRGNSTTIMQRLLAENQAKQIKVDVIVFNSADGTAVVKAGLAERFKSPALKEYPASYYAADGSSATVRLAHQGLVYNSTVLNKDQAPKSWEDLVSPRFKNKLAWSESSGTGGPLLITYFRQIWGEEKALDFVKKLQAQGIRIGAANSQGIIDQVIAGEYDVGVSITLNDIAITKDKGAPIEGVAPEPVLTQTNTIQMIKGGPSPHAAMLFVDFMLSKDGGQKVLREAAYIPAHPAVDPLPSMAWTLPRLSGKKEFIDDPAKTLELMHRSQEIFSELFKR